MAPTSAAFWKKGGPTFLLEQDLRPTPCIMAPDPWCHRRAVQAGRARARVSYQSFQRAFGSHPRYYPWASTGCDRNNEQSSVSTRTIGAGMQKDVKPTLATRMPLLIQSSWPRSWTVCSASGRVFSKCDGRSQMLGCGNTTVWAVDTRTLRD
jgi:hypothetical protein